MWLAAGGGGVYYLQCFCTGVVSLCAVWLYYAAFQLTASVPAATQGLGAIMPRWGVCGSDW